MINDFSGRFRFLSNFWSCYVRYEGQLYPSVENAYQAAKCKFKGDRSYFETCKAGEAKRQGKVVLMQPEWDSIKQDIMLDLLKQKFSTYPLSQFLLNTNDLELQEGNWWGDTYWGTVNGIGENHLGKLLMQVRNELRVQKEPLK